MKFKKTILCVLILSILLCTCGCALGSDEIERDGVTYDKRRVSDGDHYLSVTLVTGDFTATDSCYIPPEIDGIPVKRVGNSGGIMTAPFATLGSVEKIYFPWTIEEAPLGGDIRWYATVITDENGNELKYSTKCIISANTSTLIDNALRKDKIHVVPKKMYDSYDRYLSVNNLHTHIVLKEEPNVLPANISYFFNYEENPNEGYFFVDLLEESGKLTKPPYDPKRTGYKFAGWYKEAECVSVWDFEKDIVEISFDEEGNRIYEEICLYAKWEKK